MYTADQITTTKVLNANTKEELINAILEHPEQIIAGSNRNYHKLELARRVAIWLSGEVAGAYPYQANYLPRTFCIRVKALELVSKHGVTYDHLNTSPEAFAAYKERVLKDFDYFNVDEIWGKAY